MNHVVVVESYDGLMEPISDVDAEREAARGLGLPLAELAARLGCRLTVLDWHRWFDYERVPGAFPRWIPTPATRARDSDGPPRADRVEESAKVRRYSVPALDPDSRQPFATGVSPRSHGLLANSDPLFLLAYCLEIELRELHRTDPFDVVVLPMWGGLGYVAQMARACGVPGALDVGYAVVVTDTSARRQEANDEGAWTRPSLTRRQMEDVSLALADVVVTFGPRGDAIAVAGRLHDASPPVRAPRHIPPAALAELRHAAARPATHHARVQPFLHEPQDGASGVLVTLDAVALLHRRGVRLSAPVVSAGPDMVLAPMKPKGFVEYWSSRGFVRELVAEGQWQWARECVTSDDALGLRLYPSRFDHLPAPWIELARGGMVLLSPAAAEGLAPGEDLPPSALIDGEPDAPRVAASLERLLTARPDHVETVRRQLCAQVAEAHSGPARAHLLDETASALERAGGRRSATPELGRVARLFVDRRQSLQTLDRPHPRRSRPASPSPERRSLTVVVTCYEMGALLRETVESVWESTRLPDELLLIDDGSVTAATAEVIDALERDAERRKLPLTVSRQGNAGLAAARNAGLAVATGDLISFLDGDDLIEPPFYEIAAALLEENPELGGVAAWAVCFGEGVPDGFWNAPQPELPLLLVENPVIVPCMMRTDTLRALGGYDAGQRYNYEDWELSVRLVAAGHPIVTIPRYLQRYRVRSNSLLRTMTDVQHQVMRELMLRHHRETVARFGVEATMLVEHQLARHVHAPPRTATHAAGPSRRGLLDDIRRALTRTTGALIRAARR